MQEANTSGSFKTTECQIGACELSTATPTAALQARGGGAVDNSTRRQGLQRRHVVVLTTQEAGLLAALLSELLDVLPASPRQPNTRLVAARARRLQRRMEGFL